MGLAVEFVFQRRGQPGFADARFAAKQHHAAFAVLDLRPAPPQQLHFLLAADQRRETCRPQRLEPAGNRALAQHSPGADRLLETLQRGRCDGFVVETIAGEPPCRCVDHDRIRRRRRLQARGEVRRFADDVALLRLAGADQLTDHNQAGGDADPHLMLGKSLRDSFDQRERGAHGIFGVGFVRFRITEIDQHAIAHIFGDIAAEASDDVGRAFVISGDDLAQIFRIELGGQRRRADQIAKHHGELAALGRRGGARHRRCRRRRGSGSFAELAAALRAKARARRIGVAAGGAVDGLRRAALRAEAAIAGNFARAAWAGFSFRHGGSYRVALNSSFRKPSQRARPSAGPMTGSARLSGIR